MSKDVKESSLPSSAVAGWILTPKTHKIQIYAFCSTANASADGSFRGRVACGMRLTRKAHHRAGTRSSHPRREEPGSRERDDAVPDADPGIRRHWLGGRRRWTPRGRVAGVLGSVRGESLLQLVPRVSLPPTSARPRG